MVLPNVVPCCCDERVKIGDGFRDVEAELHVCKFGGNSRETQLFKVDVPRLLSSPEPREEWHVVSVSWCMMVLAEVVGSISEWSMLKVVVA